MQISELPDKRWRFDSGNSLPHKKTRTFKTRQEAEAFLAESQAQLKQMGNEWQLLPMAKKAALLTIEAEARKAGITIDRVWAEWKAANHEFLTKKSLKLVLWDYCEFLRQGGRRPKYQYEVQWYLTAFGRWWGWERNLTQLSRANIESWFDSRSEAPASVKFHVAILRGFFNWCVQRGRMTFNPAKLVVTPQIDQRLPFIMSNQGVRTLFENVQDPICRNYLVLGFYGGLRRMEIHRLRPDNFHGTNIILGGDQSKTRMCRTVHLNANVLRNIQMDKPFAPKRSWELVPRLCRDLDVHYAQNIIRHTACTHFVERLQSVDGAALQLGTSASMLAKHYKGMSTPEQTKEFMEILQCTGQ